MKLRSTAPGPITIQVGGTLFGPVTVQPGEEFTFPRRLLHVLKKRGTKVEEVVPSNVPVAAEVVSYDEEDDEDETEDVGSMDNEGAVDGSDRGAEDQGAQVSGVAGVSVVRDGSRKRSRAR